MHLLNIFWWWTRFWYSTKNSYFSVVLRSLQHWQGWKPKLVFKAFRFMIFTLKDRSTIIMTFGNIYCYYSSTFITHATYHYQCPTFWLIFCYLPASLYLILPHLKHFDQIFLTEHPVLFQSRQHKGFCFNSLNSRCSQFLLTTSIVLPGRI